MIYKSDFCDFYSMFYKFDALLKQKIYAEKKELVLNIQKKAEKAKGREIIVFHHILNIIE